MLHAFFFSTFPSPMGVKETAGQRSPSHKHRCALCRDQAKSPHTHLPTELKLLLDNCHLDTNTSTKYFKLPN